MTEKEYFVQELEQETGMSVRNIRYYTDLKLLPPPTYRGKQALYTPEHLKRIRLIQRLRDRHFPLEEIRAILYQLDDAGVDKLLEYQNSYTRGLNASSKEKPPHQVRETNQQDTVAYIDYLLGKRPTAPERNPREPGAPPLVEPALLKQLEVLPGGESWERIGLAPGIELHVQKPVNPADVENIKTLLAMARSLFKKRKRGG